MVWKQLELSRYYFVGSGGGGGEGKGGGGGEWRGGEGRLASKY